MTCGEVPWTPGDPVALSASHLPVKQPMFYSDHAPVLGLLGQRKATTQMCVHSQTRVLTLEQHGTRGANPVLSKVHMSL